jgi:hypothetical protein
MLLENQMKDPSSSARPGANTSGSWNQFFKFLERYTRESRANSTDTMVPKTISHRSFLKILAFVTSNSKLKTAEPDYDLSETMTRIHTLWAAVKQKQIPFLRIFVILIILSQLYISGDLSKNRKKFII